jgi:hypothetical protein
MLRAYAIYSDGFGFVKVPFVWRWIAMNRGGGPQSAQDVFCDSCGGIFWAENILMVPGRMPVYDNCHDIQI